MGLGFHWHSGWFHAFITLLAEFLKIFDMGSGSLRDGAWGGLPSRDGLFICRKPVYLVWAVEYQGGIVFFRSMKQGSADRRAGADPVEVWP